MATETELELEAVAEIATKVASDAEAQLAFSRSRPMRALDACDAELDRLLDDVALLAKGIAIIARAAQAKQPAA